MNFDPKEDVILVRMDELKDIVRSGVIILKDTTAQRVRTATVVKVGPGRRGSNSSRIPVDVKEGDRIAFFRWTQEHLQGKQLTRFCGDLGDNMALIREPDVLFVFSGHLRIE